ncbi:MAG: YybH family protein [Blastopirellula sp. JB062]
MTILNTALRAFLLFALITPLSVTAADGDSKRQSADSDDALSEIREQSKSFVEAFNQGKAGAIAAMWTSDGEYVDDAGRRYSGRDEIKKAYADFFAKNKGTKIHVAIDSLRRLNENVVLEDGRAILAPAPSGSPGFSQYTAIHVKQDDQWQMASVRDQWVATPSAHHQVADLNWLIGKWEAEEFGAKTTSVCRWIADKSFVERSYETTAADGTKTSGVQLIGWNPMLGQMQSWNFSGDGGHSVGLWTPHDSGFSAEMHGMTGHGVATHAINILTRLDDDAYVWQSVKRSAGGVELPDTNEVVIKRQTSDQ